MSKSKKELKKRLKESEENTDSIFDAYYAKVAEANNWKKIALNLEQQILHSGEEYSGGINDKTLAQRSEEVISEQEEWSNSIKALAKDAGVELVSPAEARDFAAQFPSSPEEPCGNNECCAEDGSKICGVSVDKRFEYLEKVVRELHKGQVDKSGVAYIKHLLAVSGSVSDKSRAAALFHDSVEDEKITVAGLTRYLSSEEICAVVLVTRDKENVTYEEFIRDIATANGEAGDMAREIKLADLKHNLGRLTPELERLRTRYEKAIEVLESVSVIPVRNISPENSLAVYDDRDYPNECEVYKVKECLCYPKQPFEEKHAYDINVGEQIFVDGYWQTVTDKKEYFAGNNDPDLIIQESSNQKETYSGTYPWRKAPENKIDPKDTCMPEYKYAKAQGEPPSGWYCDYCGNKVEDISNLPVCSTSIDSSLPEPGSLPKLSQDIFNTEKPSKPLKSTLLENKRSLRGKKTADHNNHLRS